MTLTDRKDTRKDRPSPVGRPNRQTSNEERANPVLQPSRLITGILVTFGSDVLFSRITSMSWKILTVIKHCNQLRNEKNYKNICKIDTHFNILCYLLFSNEKRQKFISKINNTSDSIHDYRWRSEIFSFTWKTSLWTTLRDPIARGVIL